MTSRSRLVLVLAGVLLLAAYVWPLWHIGLEAPQYPEGIGLYIYVDRIDGEAPGQLQNINGLNHYIGMKRIEPDAIPELRLMPWIIGALSALALAAAAGGRRWMLYAWALLAGAVAIGGLVDFYLWAYDYGHNLDPTAAIKVPGMTYQPPLIGSKQLLNFTAHSWPAAGGWAVILGIAAVAAAAVAELRREHRLKRRRTPALAALAALLLAAGCTPEPRAIHYGEEQGAHCRMTIDDERFAAQLVTRTGKVYAFDAIECMAAFYLEHPDLHDATHSLWVADYEGEGTLLHAEKAFYLYGANVRSPMGAGLAAFGPGADRATLHETLGGDMTTWQGVLDRVAQRQRAALPPQDEPSADVVARPGGAATSLADALRDAPRGGRVVVQPGVYVEGGLVIDRPVELVGVGWPVIDGGGDRQIVTVTADSVTIRGFVFRNVATSFVEDRAAVKVDGGVGCTIEGNRFEDTFFAVYLARTVGCRVAGNVITGNRATETKSGNGVHLWYSKDAVITGNEVRGHRDGIYLEFVEDSRIEGNVSAGNLRYGLHFMFSDRCRYTGNVLKGNDAGVAVMYSEHVEMTDNRFADNWGPAAYGLLLKEISDSRIDGNTFEGNTTGIYAEGVNRTEVSGNDFIENGWALKLMASSQDNTFSDNAFVANAFDVATNSRQTSGTFRANYWDRYEGYDLDRDGYGDVPHRPVRLFSLLVEQHEPALVLMRSLLVDVLDAAERVLPVLTPEAVVDDRPVMRRAV